MRASRVIGLVGLLAAVHGCGQSQRPSTPVSPSCAFSVSAPTTTFGSGGGAASASVATTSRCAWSATSQADWISVEGGSRTGSGSVSYTVAASQQTSPRTGGLTIASQSLSISQDAASAPPQECSFALSADPITFDREITPGTVRISTAPDCVWTLSKDASWLSVEEPLQGTGPATRRMWAAANDDASERQATITLADQRVALRQPGQGDCTFQVSPVESSIPRLHWTGNIDVATSRGCRWTAASDTPWMHLSALGASGSGALTYEADYNPETRYAETRTALIAIRWTAPTAGQNVRVTQWGDCHVALAAPPEGAPGFSGFPRDSLTVGPEGGTFHLFVLTDPFMGCPWTVETNDRWLSVDFPRIGEIRFGDGDLHFTVPANPSVQSRQAVLLVGGRPLTIVQKGKQ